MDYGAQRERRQGMESKASAGRVVVGVDGSPSSQSALRWAMRHAGLIGGVVEAVCAWELPGMREAGRCSARHRRSNSMP